MGKEHKPKMGKVLMAWFAMFLITGYYPLVYALPQDGQIVSGSGSITEPTATSMQVNQNTSEMIVNWNSFNIGQAESVNFFQPGTGSIALNRVIGADPSLILGNLTANGQVFVVNGSGVFFGAGSKVDTHGLIATTMAISDQDFLSHNYNFTQQGPLASVINEGNISATSYVGLLAPAVENRGTIITASLGSVDLAAGKAATLDFTGDGLINFEVTQAVSGTVTDKDGNVLQDRVSNTGTIQADGGQVRMSAKDAGDVIRHVVNMEGMIQANTVVEQAGKIFLAGGSSGVVNVTGKLTASGDNSGETGGVVHVLGEYVGLFDNAVVDVSGDTGGGAALIGGDYQGKNPTIQNAYRTYVGENAKIDASGGASGSGGKVIVWADDVTRFYGSVFATGGSLSGDGGFVEISGKGWLDYDGVVDTSAVNGNWGSLLLDPTDVIIVSTSADTSTLTDVDAFGDSDLGSGQTTIAVSAINNASSNVTIQANNDITVSAVINISTSGVTLSLQAGDDINVNKNITTNNGAITLTANDSGGSQANTGTEGKIDMADGVTLDAGNANIQLFGQGGVTISNITTTGHVNIQNTSGTAGGITRTTNSLITASSVNLDVDHTGAVDASIGTSALPIRVKVTNLDAHTHTSSSGLSGIYIESIQDLIIGGSNFVGSVKGVQSASSSGPGGDIVIRVTGNLSTLSGGLGKIDAHQGGNITLKATGDITIDDDVTAATSGAITIEADSDQNINGDFTQASGSTISSASGAITIIAVNITQNGTISSISGSKTLTERKISESDEKDVDQATNSTFLNDFKSPIESGC